MNEQELQALMQPISNAARSLYCLVLRPNAHKITGATKPLVYKSIMALLKDSVTTFELGRHINELIKELVDSGLVVLPNNTTIDQSLNGKTLVLPLLTMDNDHYAKMHKINQPMTHDWQPDQTLANELATLVGLIDKTFTQDEIGDFVSYWLGRPDANFTPFQWTQKFISNLKQKRLARGNSSTKTIGNQTVTSQAGIQADENARKLVEKYAHKK